jgi:hypothetical protein
MSQPQGRPNSREFARVQVRIRARCRVLDERSAPIFRDRIESFPTVWAPRSEGALRDLATNQSSARDGWLAQAILDVADRLVRLESTIAAADTPGSEGWIVELSGGGGRLEIGAVYERGTMLLVSFQGEDDAPPLQVIAEIVHIVPQPPPAYGFRFASIHEADRERLIRYLYGVQRRALRASHDGDEGE